MVLDAVANFVRGTTDAAIDASQTTVSVVDASIFPDPSTQGEFNVVIWDADQFPRPDQDPNVEILRVTAVDTGTDELTVSRGQEMTTGATHPSGSAVHLSPTAKMFSDIETEIENAESLTDSGTNNPDGGDRYEFPQVEDSIDLQGGGEIENAQSVDTDSINFGRQSPSDVFDSRTLNTEYQNNDSTVRIVSVVIEIDGSSAAESLNAILAIGPSSGLSNTDRVQNERLANYDDAFQTTLSGLVPAGHYYEVQSFGDETTSNWYEQQLAP